MSLKIDRVQLQIEIRSDKNRERLSALSSDIKRLKKELKKLPEGTQEHIDKLRELKAAQGVYDRLIDRIGLTGLSMKELKARQRELNMIIQNMDPRSSSYKNLKEQLGQVNNRMKELRGNAKQTGFSLNKMTDGFNKYFGMVTVFAASFTGAVLGFRKLVDIANKFEERADNLSAITGLVGNEFEWLTEKAKETSIATIEGNIKIKQSATDIVDAYTIVGSQRPELLKNKEALHGVTEDAIILSEAAKIKLEPAVAGLTMAMNQLGYESDQSRRIINVMAAGSKEGSANVAYLTEAYEKSGTTARLMGIDVEQLTGVIEGVAPSYSEASMAGNSFDKVLLKMKANNIGYVNGQFNLNAAIEELEKRYAAGETAAQLFGSEHSKMGELLVLNKEEIIRYTDAVTGTQIALEQAEKNTNNNAAALAQAKNRFELTAITLGQKLAPALTFSTNGFSYLMKAMMAAPKIYQENKTLIHALAGALLALNGRRIATTALMIKDHLMMQKGIGLKIKDKITTMALANAEARKAIMMGTGTKAMKIARIAAMEFGAAMKTALGPVGLVILAITGIATAVKLYDKYNAKSVRLEKEKKEAIQDLTDANDKLEISLGELSEQVQHLNRLSAQEKLDLREKITLKLQEAEVELQLAEAKKKQIYEDNNRTTTWQKLKNTMLGAFNPASGVANNIIDGFENAANAADELNPGLERIREMLKSLTGQSEELNEILGAEGIADKIKGDNVASLEEKVNKYQIALKNAKIGSDEYDRIQKKLITTQALLTKATKKAGDAAKDSGEKGKKAAEERLKWDLELQKAIIDNMEEGREKEIALETLRHTQTIASYNNEVKDVEIRNKLKEEAEIQHFKNLQNIAEKYRQDPTEVMTLPAEANVPDITDDPAIKQAILTEAYKREQYEKTEQFRRDELRKSLDENKISEQEYMDEITAMSLENIRGRLEQTSQMFGQLGELASTLQDTETAKAETKYNKDIAMAGDNEAEKEKLTKEFEAKKLKIQKKYAKTEFLIKVGKIIADTAVAIMQAYAQLGPVGGTIAAVILAGVGIAQEESARAEMNKIEGYKKGLYPMRTTTGMYNVIFGGDPYTQLVDQPTHFVAGEQGKSFPEMIIDGPTFKNLRADFPMAIDAINYSHAKTRGYADGYYPATPQMSDDRIINLLAEILEQTKKPTRAKVLYSDLEDADTEVADIRESVS